MKYEQFYDFIIKMQSIAKIGLVFSRDPYAIENYKEINDLSLKMLENFNDVKFDRNSYFSRDIYPTPNVSNRTFIFNKKGQLLLVKESATQTWSVPGGWCDLYDSPKDAALAEVSQEAGVDVNISRLVAILNRTPFKKSTSVPEYVIVFEAHMDEECFHNHTHETDAVSFFDVDKLPVMSNKLSMDEITRIIDACKNNKTIFD